MYWNRPVPVSFGEQAAQIFPVQPYIVGNAVQRQFVHIMRVYIDDDGLHLFLNLLKAILLSPMRSCKIKQKQLFKSLRGGGLFLFP